MLEQLFILEMVLGAGQHTAASCVEDAIMFCVVSNHWSCGKAVAAGRGSEHHRTAEKPASAASFDDHASLGRNPSAVSPGGNGRD
jgi:hypothetical protein